MAKHQIFLMIIIKDIFQIWIEKRILPKTNKYMFFFQKIKFSGLKIIKI